MFWGAILSRVQNPKEEWDMVGVGILRGGGRLGKEKCQGLNPGLLYCRQILNHLSHQGSPKSWTPAALEAST